MSYRTVGNVTCEQIPFFKNISGVLGSLQFRLPRFHFLIMLEYKHVAVDLVFRFEMDGLQDSPQPIERGDDPTGGRGRQHTIWTNFFQIENISGGAPGTPSLDPPPVPRSVLTLTFSRMVYTLKCKLSIENQVFKPESQLLLTGHIEPMDF